MIGSNFCPYINVSQVQILLWFRDFYDIKPIGSNFCPYRNASQVQILLWYRDFTITKFVEVYAYPIEEMLNELAGIFGLYFGFSFIAAVLWLWKGIQILKVSIQNEKNLRNNSTTKSFGLNEIG